MNPRMVDFVIGSKIDLVSFLSVSGSRVKPFQGGEKWFIKGFLDFQYGPLQETNRVHVAVINELKKEGLWIDYPNSFQGAKDKDKDKDKEKEKDKGVQGGGDLFDIFWKAYPRKDAKAPARKAWERLRPSEDLLKVILEAIARVRVTEGWLKDDGKFIPLPASWLNAKRWEDELRVEIPRQKTLGERLAAKNVE